MPSLRQLEYLVVLSEEKHFSKAADRCAVSQPTLSVQIQNLEDSLGVQLIERQKKNLFLTSYGVEVVEMARQALGAVSNIKEYCDGIGGALTGKITIGVIPTIAPYFLPILLPIIQDEYPELEIYLKEEKTPDLVNMLLNGYVDVCLLALPIDEDNQFQTLDIFQEPFVAAIPKNHAFSNSNSVDVSALKEGELLLLEEGHCLRNHALDACHLQRKTGINATFNATSLETLKHMVSAGRGVTLLPFTAVDANAPYLVKPLNTLNASRKISLMWRKTSMRSTEFRLLAKVISGASDALNIACIMK